MHIQFRPFHPIFQHVGNRHDKLRENKTQQDIFFFLFLITKTVFVFHKEQRETLLGERHKYNFNISL